MTTEAGLSDSIGWRVTAHARDAATRRGFSLREVLLAVAAPDLTYPQENYGEGRALYRRGRVAVVVHAPSRTVITVLLNSADEWSDADCRESAAAA